LHDEGTKTLLGQSGNFDGDAVLDILLARPATAEFITRKLWREFVSPEPDEREVRRIAARFRESGYDIRTALRWLLLSPAFWSQQARGSLIKSPVDLVVGTLRDWGRTCLHRPTSKAGPAARRGLIRVPCSHESSSWSAFSARRKCRAWGPTMARA
jgi:uncharacterized protein (DUF1800 family)